MKNLVIVKKYALNYLSKYDSTKKNLLRILKNKVRRLNIEKKEKYILYNSIESIILELESKKIIDDQEYANRKIHNFACNGKSKIFIINYLNQKGIDKNLLEEALNNYELNNPEWELKSCRIFARKKGAYIKNNDLEKLLGKMSRAGFNYNICKKVLDL